ncbi:MAG TPA: 4Fe-4S binding protein [Methanoregulaceae archaeon]|nr:4Fe-4S binding protein [Methanoregulaceae archaeon]
MHRSVHARGGVITQANPERVTVRTRLPAGILTLDQLRGLGEIAERFGADHVHLTTRQTVEIPHLDPDRIEELARDLEANGTPVGAERHEVVNIVACPGTDRCKYANVETIGLAQELDRRFFGRDLPVKVRITVAGCPNCCNNALLNEIGIIGRIRPIRTPGLCTGCGTCVQYCREQAVTIRNGVCRLDEDRCSLCGMCIHSCPFSLIRAEDRHYLVLVGGMSGRHPTPGRELIRVDSPETVVAVVDRVVYWVYRQARANRLLGEQLDELDFNRFRETIQKEFGDGGLQEP